MPVFRYSPLILLLAGCVDAIGVGPDCDAEMRQIRNSQGQPAQVQEDHSNGDHVVQWIYAGNRSYTFRWGASYDACEVQGP